MDENENWFFKRSNKMIKLASLIIQRAGRDRGRNNQYCKGKWGYLKIVRH